MKRKFLMAAMATATLLLAGCASGPKFDQVIGSMPTVKPGEGRIYFFRSNIAFGGAIQPEIRLDGIVVGKSQPGGFFYVDRPAGMHAVSTTTETEKNASFMLDAGETKYVRTSPSFGILVWRIVVELATPDTAKAELQELRYTGGAAK